MHADGGAAGSDGKIVTAMGGALEVRSAPDRGSCFYFAPGHPRAPDARSIPARTCEEGGCPEFEAIPAPPPEVPSSPR